MFGCGKTCSVARLPVIVIDRFAVWETAGSSESVTFTVKFEVPTADGVPLMAPVAAFNVKPAGSAPVEMLQAYGAKPPVAASVCE